MIKFFPMRYRNYSQTVGCNPLVSSESIASGIPNYFQKKYDLFSYLFLCRGFIHIKIECLNVKNELHLEGCKKIQIVLSLFWLVCPFSICHVTNKCERGTFVVIGQTTLLHYTWLFYVWCWNWSIEMKSWLATGRLKRKDGQEIDGESTGDLLAINQKEEVEESTVLGS